MSRYPSATWRPLSGTSTARLTKDVFCLHTMVGYLGSTWTYFERPDIRVYSHFGVGGIWGGDLAAGLDGVAWQMADTDYRSAANLDGNWRVISVETADNAARPLVPWTPRQQDTIVRLMVDAHRLDGIPLALVPDSRIGRRGIAYHRLGCDPYRVADGELWSSAYGKDCPTDPRIAQLPALVERAQNVVNGGGLHMDTDVQAAFDSLGGKLDRVLAQFDPRAPGSLIDKLNRTGARLADVQAAVSDDEANISQAVRDQVEAARREIEELIADTHPGPAPQPEPAPTGT